LSSMPNLRLLLTFAIVFSLVSLPSVLSNNFILPNIPIVRAQQETTSGSWYPAGAQEQTLSISQVDGASITQVEWLLTNKVDIEDWPLTATQQGASTVNCSGNVNVLCSLPVPDHGYFVIEFNLANVLWGVPMQYGNSAAGVELRQGMAHLLNKESFATNNAACLGVACVPNDQAIPACTVSVGCTNGGLYAANPCGWDTKYNESSSTWGTWSAAAMSRARVVFPDPVLPMTRIRLQPARVLEGSRRTEVIRHIITAHAIECRPRRHGASTECWLSTAR